MNSLNATGCLLRSWRLLSYSRNCPRFMDREGSLRCF